MTTSYWQRNWEAGQGPMTTTQLSYYAGNCLPPNTVVRSRISASAVGVGSVDAPVTTTGRVVAGVGLCTRVNNGTGSSPAYPFTDRDNLTGPLERWLWWGILPAHLTARDAGNGIMAWEYVLPIGQGDSKGQVKANLPAGQQLDLWLTVELSEDWDPSGSLFWSLGAELLVQGP